MNTKLHTDRLPINVDKEVVYVRLGYAQYWRNPKGGWDITNYGDVLKTIEYLDSVVDRKGGTDEK